VPFPVYEHVALGVRKVEKLLENGIDLVNVILVEDESFLADIVTICNNGPPPELLV